MLCTNMSVQTLLPVEEYLKTSYGLDMENVDGVLVDRNAGEWLHSSVLGHLISSRTSG